jgi:class 3 adenylate cyclase/tetratricopeptide (TPR) repeat protein
MGDRVSLAVTETVSVLMTDLVGSTAMAARVGPEAAERLRQEHFGLLRAALDRTGGREVKNLGDGLMVVFQSASKALECAVDMQQSVEGRNRRAERQLGVRIGVSLGEATREDGDYFGEPVVESARLCASAEGGQILLNALVRQIAGAREGLSFVSVGGLELKGISEPVQAYELRWDPLLATGIALPERLRELPATGYVGRQQERSRLTELWTQAREGSLRLALISGEAGVGKTRLATHLALQARGEGATVLYGRCDEDLGVPFQPWAQALGHLVREVRRPVLDGHVERHTGNLVRLVPGLGDRVADLPVARQGDPETERYLLHAAAASLLEDAGEEEPVLLILDDLQWADQPTLSLLRHVLASSAAMRVMILAVYRESDLSRDHPLTALLADLHRDHGGDRIKLTGLESADVLALIEALAGHELDQKGRQLASEITRETAGNPFFAGELIRHLTESGAIVHEQGERWRVVGDVAELGLPQSVREVTGRRVERLGPDARMALSAAAVIGRDFDLSLLSRALDVPETQLLDLLDDAVAASLLQESSERAGRFTFTHALVEHTLTADLGRTRRALLHREIAQALEEQCGDQPGERLGELAAHWAAAGGGGDSAKAADYARRAGERALQQLAPDEAARWYRQALELRQQSQDGDRHERCELLIGLGEAQRQIGDAEYRVTLLDAAELAEAIGDTDRLCRAVLANGRGWTRFGALDAERVHALETAERALARDDPRRAQVLALLAGELHHAVEPERCRSLAEEAIAIARAAGDPAALALTLNSTIWTIWVPATLSERQLLVEELLELAPRVDDPRLSFWAATRSAMIGLETGEHSRIESGLETMRSVSAAVPQPSLAYMLLLLEFGLALIDGDLQASRKLADEARELGSSAGEPGAAMTFLAHRFHIDYLEGRGREHVDGGLRLDGRPDSHAGWRAGTALALIEGERSGEARERALAEDFQDVPVDQAWLPAIFAWAQVCARLALVERAEELYRLLTPFAGRFCTQAGVTYGSVDVALGALAATLGRHGEAERHFAAASELEERLGAPLLLAHTQASWARALAERGRTADSDRVGPMLDRAEQSAARAGAGAIAREIAEVRALMAPVRR